MASTQKKNKPTLDPQHSPETMALLAIGCAMEKKASRPVVMDLRHLGSFFDFFAIVSASNSRQVYAIAQEIKVFFKKAFGLYPVSIDGLESSNWVLMDYGFLFVHIFVEPTREMYQLEKLWNKARMVEFTEDQCLEMYRDVMKSLPEEENSDHSSEDTSPFSI